MEPETLDSEGGAVDTEGVVPGVEVCEPVHPRSRARKPLKEARKLFGSFRKSQSEPWGVLPRTMKPIHTSTPLSWYQIDTPQPQPQTMGSFSSSSSVPKFGCKGAFLHPEVWDEC